MTATIDWGTKAIAIPKADLTLVSGVYFTYDTQAFRLELKVLESSEEGTPHLDTHSHSTEVTVAGITYARVIEIINGYTVEFEDPGGAPGQYAVSLTGSNNNIFEDGILVHNQVSVISNNSAGLVNVTAVNESLNLVRGLYGLMGP